MPLADELLAITNCRQTLDLNGVIAVEKSVLKALDFSLYNPNLYYETDPLVVCSYFTNFRTFVESSSVQLKKKTSSALVEYHDAIVEVSQASW